MAGSLSDLFSPGMRGCVVFLAASVTALGAGPLGAFETDQYLAVGVELADSGPVINEFINRNVEDVLERVNRRKPQKLACEKLASRIYLHLFHSIFSSKLERFVKKSDLVDRFPGNNVSGLAYSRRSIYRRPAFPFVVPLSRTIRIGEVRLGIDKLNHLFGFGRRYHNRYQKHLRRGLSEEEALRRVLSWGLMMERYFVGGLADGVFSYADLEANYQGLELARAFCEGPEPHLELSEGRWRLAREIRLEEWVNHDFDESINNNHYVGHRWIQVRPALIKTYCPLVASGEMTTIERADPSLSARFVAGYFSSKGKERQRLHSLQVVCDPIRAAKGGSLEMASN